MRATVCWITLTVVVGVQVAYAGDTPEELIETLRNAKGFRARAGLKKAEDALVAHGAAAVAPLIAFLQEPKRSRDGERTAATALGRIGKPALPGLLTLIEKGDRGASRQAFAAIERLGPEAESALPTLLKHLHDPMGPRAVGAIGEPAVGPLRAVLEESDSVRIAGAITALGIVGKPAREAVPRLVELLGTKGQPSYMRPRLIMALAGIGEDPEHAVPALIPMLDDKVAASSAAKALAVFGPRAASAVDALTRAVKEGRGGAEPVKALGKLGVAAKPAVPHIVALLGKPPKYMQHAALAALADLGPVAAECVPQLTAVVSDAKANPALRAGTAKCLGAMGSKAKAAVPGLVTLLNQKDDMMLTLATAPTQAALALGAIGGKQALKALLAALGDLQGARFSWTYEIAVIQGLAAMGKKAKAARRVLKKARNHSDEDLRTAVRAALKAIR